MVSKKKNTAHGKTVGDVLAQGDVLLVRVNNLPENSTFKKVERDRGCIVLAYGEVTGHAHAIAEAEVDLLLLEKEVNERYLVVREAAALVHGTLPGDGKVQELAEPDHSTIKLEPGTYKVVEQHTYSWGESQRVAD